MEDIKYLGVQIDTNLAWEHHINNLSNKLNLNRANGLLSKIRKYVSLQILRSIYMLLLLLILLLSCLCSEF